VYRGVGRRNEVALPFVMAKRKREREREASGIIFRERENGEKAYKLVGPVTVIKLGPT
jgi:hypothetical protein